MVQNTGRSPRIAQVFKVQETGADTVCFRVVGCAASGEDRGAQCGGQATRAGGESRQAPLTEMHHGWTLADTADDLPPINPLDEFVEIVVTRRIGADDSIFDRDANALF